LSLDFWGIAWVCESIAKDEAVSDFKMADVLGSDIIVEFLMGVEEVKSLEHLVHDVSKGFVVETLVSSELVQVVT